MNAHQVVTTRKQWEHAEVDRSSPRDVIKHRWLTYLGPLATQKRTLPKLEILQQSTTVLEFLSAENTTEVLSFITMVFL